MAEDGAAGAHGGDPAQCILIVDDDAAICDVLRRFLEREGFEVLLAHNGAEGARTCRRRVPDGILLDIHMPEMDGIELLVQLKSVVPTVPIIVMSGGDDTRRLGFLGDPRLLGADAMLAKPFTLAELRELIAQVLAASQANGA